MAEQEPFTGAEPTITVTDCIGEVCAFPLHWKVKVVLEVRGAVNPLPFNGDEAFDHGPPAVQLVALVELHVRVA